MASWLGTILNHDTFEWECNPRCMQLFDANLEYKFDEDISSLTSEVKVAGITLIDVDFGDILGIFMKGADMAKIETTNLDILQWMSLGAVGI